MRVIFVLLFVALALQAQSKKLLVISIDGLDARYLNEPDKHGLQIPTLRKLAREGAHAAGVVGIVPTVTWPSHTTIITGVPSEEHGILSNDQPGKPGQRWWFVSFLKARTLWHATAEKRMKTATVYWPVTVGADVAFNFPEFWKERAGHSIEFEPIAEKATPGLVERVAKVYPSFPRSQWTDTGAMQAVRYLLEYEKPSLTLVHIADLDSEEHDFGAFSRPAKAVLEQADYLVGWTLEKLPADTLVAIVSDHGFDNAVHMVRPKAMLREAGVNGQVEVKQGLIGALDDASLSYLRTQVGKNGIDREVAMDEVRTMAPALRQWKGAFDMKTGYFASADDRGAAVSDGSKKGNHGLWPTRRDYRASFVLWGPEVRKQKLPEMSMLDIAPTFAEILGVELPAAKRKSKWPELRERR